MSAPGAPEPELAPADYAARAGRAYAAMQRRFWRRAAGIYRRDGRLHLPGAASHLWPLARAMVATLDLAGVAPGPAGGFDTDAAIADCLHALERYWDPRGPCPAYASDPVGARWGGARYYDDNAWVGLGLVQLERMRPGAGRLARARTLYDFAVQGWDRRLDVPQPGGVFWVEQGRGVGARNHDRNTVSTAPNAQLGLHLAELGADVTGPVDPAAMHAWVERALAAPNGLLWDKIRGDGSVDRALWSYNQGNVVGLNVLLARADPDRGASYLDRAEAVAGAALSRYAGGYERQPAAFNAIFFRNLLQLHAATARVNLRDEIVAALRAYADLAWSAHRDDHDCFRFSGRAPTLLDQSAMVSVLSLLAWDPGAYGRLA